MSAHRRVVATDTGWSRPTTAVPLTGYSGGTTSEYRKTRAGGGVKESWGRA
jgi:hypothetical protein